MSPSKKAPARVWRPWLAEFLGTFVLVFCGTSVATLQGFAPGYGTAAWLGTSLAFSAALFVSLMVFGPVSSCHVNPAVSLAMACKGKLPWRRLPGYWVSQYAGALAASLLLLTLLKGTDNFSLANVGLAGNSNPHAISLAALFTWEVVLTCMLVLVTLAANQREEDSLQAAVAASVFLLVAHLIGVPLGGASLNPARSFGPAVLQQGQALQLLWLYSLGPFAGGLAGFGIFRLVCEK